MMSSLKLALRLTDKRMDNNSQLSEMHLPTVNCVIHHQSSKFQGEMDYLCRQSALICQKRRHSTHFAQLNLLFYINKHLQVQWIDDVFISSCFIPLFSIEYGKHSIFIVQNWWVLPIWIIVGLFVCFIHQLCTRF